MPPQTPIGTLEEAQAWLATIKPSTTEQLSSDLFSAPEVNDVFALLGSDPVALSVTAVDSAAATLEGTATVFAEAGTTALFHFTQPATALLCELTLTLPESLEWSLLSAFDIAFGGLEAQFAPNDAGVIGLTFSATVTAGPNADLSIPVSLAVPTFDGDWLLSSSIESKIGKLNAQALTAVAGGIAPTSILPSDLAILDNFELTDFEVAFNPSKETCSLIRVCIDYSADWKFFGDEFTVESIDLDFVVREPFTADAAMQATLSAKVKIGGSLFDVGGQFPDEAVFAQLAPGSSVKVNDVFEFMHVALPSGFPTIELSTLSFLFNTAQRSFDFQVGITDPVPLIGTAKLDNFFFEIAATYDATKGVLPTGNLHSELSIGSTVLLLSGSYAEGGINLSGEVDDVGIGDIVAKLADDFGIPKSSIPAPILGLELKTAKATLDTSKSHFTFTCEGTTTFADLDVDFTPTIDLTYASGKFGVVFGGTLVLQPVGGGDALTFSVTFNDADPADTWITAEYTGAALGLNDLAKALDFPLPHIPDGLDLGLTAIGFYYDFASGALVIGADSKSYGLATLASVKVGDPAKRRYFFVLDTNQTFSLSNLPLVGRELAQVANVEVSELKVIIATATVDGTAAGTINTEIGRLKTRTYPTLPANGITGEFIVSAQLQIGDESPVPLEVSLGGGNGNQRQLVAGDAELLPAVGAPGASDGATWVTIQKSLGPVTFQKIGIRYRDSVLYFLLNASVSGGGLTIAVMGLGVGSPLTSFEPKFTIDGLAVTYASGPLEISGALIGTIDPINFYGELVIGAEQLQIAALGGYCEIENHPSLFLYAVLDYPIGGPAFFFVTGLAAGFGFNRKLVLPPVDGVATFPFVQWALGTGSPPPMDPDAISDTVIKVVSELSDSGVVAPSVGEDWFAVGVKFTSFELVNSFALLTVIFGTQFEVALLGISSVQLPPAPADPVALAELQLEATFIPSEGALSVSGQLTPQSFVLSRDCHLTGGFALATWFSGDHEGEFVLTIGGYSPRFQPPPYYPTVPRLGLNWQVTSELAVNGDLYFALTSSAVMGGGGLSAVWQSDDIRAWFDVEADFLIVFEPFHYYISVGIHLGASFTLDLLFTSITVSIHIGVDLAIWGPEFAGEATIDLSIISFTITFNGGSPQTNTTIGWDDFVKKLIPSQPAAKDSALLAAAPPPEPAVVQITVQDGLVKRLSDADGDLNWVVNGQRLALVTQSAIPTKDWSFSKNITLVDHAPKTNPEFGIGPVGVDSGALTSTHTISIDTNEASAFHADPVVRNVATALWQTRQFDENGVPIGVDPLNSTTLDGVAVGFTITPFVKPPHHTLRIHIEDLEYTIADPIKPFAWTDAVAPETDSFSGETVWGTIAAPGPAAVRSQLVTAIAGEGWPVPTDIDVTELSSQAAYDLVANPLLRLLGEQR